uniref:Uncharacterized protein n=3 Tax=Opuntia streptacantha TaxID=393608 RepID=A0A7C8ZR00_OPUST
MAMAPPPPSLRLRNSSISLSPPTYHLFLHPPKPPTPLHLSFIPKASSDSGPGSPEPESLPQSSEDDPFESRLDQIRIKYRSGTGKKAEARKMRKGKKGAGSGSGVFLPPVPLKEPVSGGLKVDFGFSPYSERLNGRLAGLGLVALLLVELSTGKSTINYHTPAILFVQVYFMTAASALYCKYEKEKVSVWPNEVEASSSNK